MTKIIIIEDEELIRSFVATELRERGFVVEDFGSGLAGLAVIDKIHPDLVVLDLGLPDVGGESVLQSIRSKHPTLPVIILTAKAGASHVSEGLNLGADDYMTKPFEMEELIARIHARLRSSRPNETTMQVDDLRVDLAKYEVTRSGALIDLSKTEFDLLIYLLKNKGKVLTRDQLLNHVWGYDCDIESRVVDVYISYLRKKIDSDSPRPLIFNKRGVGYMLKEN